MDNLTIIIPFFNGHQYMDRLIDSIPAHLPVIIIDDQSDIPLKPQKRQGRDIYTLRLDSKGYFTGAVNAGIKACKTDVLILNQDTWFSGPGWLNTILARREKYALIGERILGKNPKWPAGYIHGTFMYIRRDAINKIGLMAQEFYPLWGSTCEYQLRAYRQGFDVLALKNVPDFHHARGNKPFGSSINAMLKAEPDKRGLLLGTPPLISVVIGAYNHGKYLKDAINSLVGGPTSMGDRQPQTLQSFEIIIVNDGSTDNTHEIMLELADDRKGIRYIRQKNKGSAAACNTGIQAANGAVIAIMDADDMMEPKRLEMMYRTLLTNPHHVVCDDMKLFKEGQYILKPDKSILYWSMPTYNFDLIIQKNTMHKGLMYPKRAWQEAGGYPVVMDKGREDWAFNVGLGVAGWCGVRCTYPGYMYRREGQNRTLKNTNPFSHEKFKQQLFGLYPDIYAGGRPVGCCGRNKSKNAGGKNAGAKKGNKNMTTPGKDGMVLIEYQGGDASQSSWWGSVSKTRYIFGGKRKRGYVDVRDVPEFTKMYEGSRQLFVKVPTTATRQVVQSQPVKSKTVSAKPIKPIKADDVVTVAELTKPIESPFNPEDFSNKEIGQKLKEGFDKGQLTALLESEKSGRNRKGAIGHINDAITKA